MPFFDFFTIDLFVESKQLRLFSISWISRIEAPFWSLKFIFSPFIFFGLSLLCILINLKGGLMSKIMIKRAH